MFALKRFAVRYRAKFLIAAPVFALLALLSWAIASPVGSSPDDDFHLSSIWCANDFNQSYCAPGDEPGERVVPESITKAHICYNFDVNTSAACQSRSFSFDPDETAETFRGSFSNNYPPVYYATMSAFVTSDIQASVLIMRAVNVLLFVGLTTLLYLLLPVRLRATLLGAWTVSIVPLGVFIIASNNPSAWALIGLGTAWLALAGYYESEGRRRTALGALFGVSAIMAAGSRADSAIYMGLAIVVVVFLYFRRDREFFRRTILPFALAVVSLFFYLASGQSSVAIAGLGSIEDLGPPTPVKFLLQYNIQYFTDLYAGVFGTWKLGWLDTPMPPIVVFGAVIAFVGLVFVGIGVMHARKGIALTLVALALFGLPMYVLYVGNNFVGEVLQPRYLLPLVLLFAGIALLPRARRTVRLTRVQAVLLAILLATSNSFALHINIRRYISGLDVLGANLNASVEWWWTGFVPTPLTVWVIGTLAFGAAAFMVLWEVQRLQAITRELEPSTAMAL